MSVNGHSSDQRWVKTGGIVYIEAGGAALNEFNETGHTRATLAPFDSLGLWTGGPSDNINQPYVL